MIRQTILTVDAAACDLTQAVGWCYHLHYACDRESVYRHLHGSGSLKSPEGITSGCAEALRKGTEKMVTTLNIRYGRVILRSPSTKALGIIRHELSSWGIPPDNVKYEVENFPSSLCRKKSEHEMTSLKNLFLDSSL